MYSSTKEATMRSLIIGSAVLDTAIAAPTQAAEVAGVKLEDSVRMSADRPKLALNGHQTCR